ARPRRRAPRRDATRRAPRRAPARDGGRRLPRGAPHRVALGDDAGAARGVAARVRPDERRRDAQHRRRTRARVAARRRARRAARREAARAGRHDGHRDRRMTEPLRAARFGWTSLLAWAATGLALETAHGLKLAAYLDDALVRLLLTLAHAHGVGLALVVLAH